MEVVVYQPEVVNDNDETVEGGLQARKSRHRYVDSVVPEPSKNNTYLDKNGGAVEDLDIHKIMNVVQANKNGKTKTAINDITEETTATPEPIEEETTDEEVVELEFEKLIPSDLHTHTMFCPNCDNQITKVVLRRKIIKKKPARPEEHHKPLFLHGCLSCLGLFIQTDDGRFNPFLDLWNRPASNEREDGNCLSFIRVLITGDKYQQGKPQKPGDQLPISVIHDGQPDVGVTQPEHHDTIVDMPSYDVSVGQTLRPESSQDSRSFEILKSIVYGGLMEVIASLSIVASAAAGEASTQSIITLAMANLVGGVFVIGHNLWDLKDDCYKFSSQQTNDQHPRTKYTELLGSVNHFPMHVFFVILSFIVFGIIPPVAYGYTFQETTDRDLTMAVVAAASLLCVGLLAIFKAYIDRSTGFGVYVKTITYYITTAVSVSGVSYVAGNLVMRLIEKLGLFETSPMLGSTNPSLAYY